MQQHGGHNRPCEFKVKRLRGREPVSHTVVQIRYDLVDREPTASAPAAPRQTEAAPHKG
jgi:hypothetical protein